MATSRMAITLCSALLVAGCGSSPGSRTSSAPASQGSAAGGNNSPVLSAEAQSKATGDIPDTQAFLTYRDSAAGYSVSYPEGWTQSGAASDVSFHDKNNVIHVVIATGGAPTAATVSSDLSKQRASAPTLKPGAPAVVSLKSGPAIKVSYTTQSPPNPVTGKRVTLVVDRFVIAHGARHATLDLGSPVGVDNRDAYKMISQSFKWQ